MRLIDADALIAKLDEQIQMPTFMGCLSAINSAPTIEPKRGKWEVKQSGFAECSVCEQCYFSDYNFCPNCGADMRGKDDE